MKNLIWHSRFWSLCFVLLSVFGVSLGFAKAQDIHIISREDGSGTRSAFVELFGIYQTIKDKKIDNISKKAEITNSTAVMLVSVTTDEDAIGYVSLGSLNSSVKALKINDVEPSIEQVKNKQYILSRPFNVVTNKYNPLAQDFLQFALSQDAQDIVVKAGYIPMGEKSFTPANPSGKLVIAGSSSITPLMEKLKGVYLAQNKNAKIEIQQSDSSTGISATLQGIADIGMVSRELKESERAKNLTTQVLALDGLAVIVNPKNPIQSLRKEQIKAIFEGNTAQWNEVINQ